LATGLLLLACVIFSIAMAVVALLFVSDLRACAGVMIAASALCIVLVLGCLARERQLVATAWFLAMLAIALSATGALLAHRRAGDAASRLPEGAVSARVAVRLDRTRRYEAFMLARTMAGGATGLYAALWCYLTVRVLVRKRDPVRSATSS
jgi:hypothetical protein